MSEENVSPELQENNNRQAIDNYAIADQFSLLSKLMDIHGENAFKAKSYASAAFAIEKSEQQLSGLTEAQMAKVRGLGESIGKKVTEIIRTGELKALRDLIQQTPEGVLEMMNIKGIGPKKINIIWKEMGLATIDELEKACRENRIATRKGFGEKTEQKILASILFGRENQGQYLYKHVEDFVSVLQTKMEAKFPAAKTAVTGQFRRQLETISKLEWVTTAGKQEVKNYLLKEEVTLVTESDESILIQTESNLQIAFYFATADTFEKKLLETSCSEEFLLALLAATDMAVVSSEEDVFKKAGLNYIHPYLRESADIIRIAKTKSFDDIIQPSSIKGLIHSHSNWSDGSNTIEEMATTLMLMEFEYLVISDHSKAAYYANGLSETKIKEQHQYIDELNKKLHPFKIFKSIECDILGDGSLDYDDETLSSFDLVIASVHSNLDMDEDKAMMRLMGAITNPFTTILGHMTGRLLLKRAGYPVDHKAIIDACAENNVAIEINASPRRLDMDWRWVAYAVEKRVLLSINPDAHSLEEFQYVKYGTLVAQKGGLPAAQNVSSFTLKEFEAYLAVTKKTKGIK